MKTIAILSAVIVLLMSTVVPGCQQAAAKIGMGSIANGGKIYDNWAKTIGVMNELNANHAMWVLQTTNNRAGVDTWRCKECHGWDYRGKDGAYGKGSHYTGFPGVYEASLNQTTDQLRGILEGKTDSRHSFASWLNNTGISDVVNFLKEGLIDHSKYIDYSTKKPISANIAHGKKLFSNTCLPCHGEDGKKLLLDEENLGFLSNDNPWETLHKIRSGQPGTSMPSSIISGWSIQDAVDTLGYAQSLPK